MLKHATATVFVFAKIGPGWHLGLVKHPRFGRMMAPGGAVEAGENAAEAAVREVSEETGLQVTLLASDGLPFTSGVVNNRVPMPMWVVEQPVPADGHLPHEHIHVDHLFVAVADQPHAASGAHPFGWFVAESLGAFNMFEQTRDLAIGLFTQIDDLVATQASRGSITARS